MESIDEKAKNEFLGVEDADTNSIGDYEIDYDKAHNGIKKSNTEMSISSISSDGL